jgi:CBS domain-containing protein
MSKNEDVWTADDEVGISSGPAVELFMGETVPLVDPSTTLREAAECLREAEVGLLVVGTADAVKGVVSERDIVRCVALGVDLDSTTVEDVESEDLKWATRDTSVAEVVEEMMEHYLRHVLIAGDDGRLVGVASMRDLIAAFLD